MKPAMLPLFSAFAIFAYIAYGADLPNRAAGLWEEKLSNTMAPGTSHTQRMCVDDKLGNFLRAYQGNCSKHEVRKEGSGYVIGVSR